MGNEVRGWKCFKAGTKRPTDCKIPCAVDRIIIPAVIEMLDVTAKAKETLDAVPVWSA